MKSRIGIVGGGQLGRMMAFDAKKLGFTVSIIDPTPNSPAGQVVDKQIVAPYNDEKAIRELAKNSDFLTFEIELANAHVLDDLTNKGLEIHPSAKTLSIIKDKLEQKKFLRKAGLPVADFAPVISSDNEISRNDSIKQEIETLAKKFGYPLLLKARFDAYDGRGNALIKNKNQIDKALEKLRGRKLYVEKFVPFVKELAIMVARSTKEAIATYPVVETIHKNNICHLILAPASVDETIRKKAKMLAINVMKNLKGAGVFGIEMFLTHSSNSGQAKLFINEIAPRVHNSGHYTIEACVTSQFEQHIRAVTGQPLGATDMIVPASVMINILGERNAQAEVTGLDKALKIPNVFIHIYGKMETKLERKMGHITVIGKTLAECLKKAKQARKAIVI
ncbi:MAG TPA: 5-(carboxyamino)imidazole ribonucleotide synthase [Methylomirabilota bacterium]|nr:5-(carboxyamino)imidazole ribonucleotide synthase [Methylomirabilota bacterium]